MIVRSSPLRLLNPGPVTLSPRVRQSLAGPDLCDSQPEFRDLQQELRGLLQQVYGSETADFEAIILTGSGTLAVEAMVGSLVPDSGHCLVIANGVYGERIGEMLKLHGKDFLMVRGAWEEPIPFEAVARSLARQPRPTFAIAVHHETTTGRLNDLAALGQLCQAASVPLIVDAVSSFGAEPIEFRRDNIWACAGSANQCLHGAPGVSFVLVRRDLLENGQSAARSLYLDLYAHYEAQSRGTPAFTPSIPVHHALREALHELGEQGGWQARHAEYIKRSQCLRQGLARKGYATLLSDPTALSSSLTSFRLPDDVEFESLYDSLRAEGFILRAGNGRLYHDIFRVAVMGDLRLEDLASLVESFPSV